MDENYSKQLLQKKEQRENRGALTPKRIGMTCWWVEVEVRWSSYPGSCQKIPCQVDFLSKGESVLWIPRTHPKSGELGGFWMQTQNPVHKWTLTGK